MIEKMWGINGAPEAEAAKLRDALAGTVWVYRWRDRDFEFGFGKMGDLQLLMSWKGIRWRAVSRTEVVFETREGGRMFLSFDDKLQTFKTKDWDGEAATGRRTDKKLP
jgi:hypothetical protein